MSIAQKVLADPGKYSIQQLQQAVQNGIIPAYIAVPIIQAKVQEQKQRQMAQSMQQPPAQQQAPVAERVMAEARGLEALPTNLPAQYASGGIVAFDEGGEVPRFQVGGMPRYETPYDRMNRLNREKGLMLDQLFTIPNDPQAVADRSAMGDTLSKITAAGKDIVTLPGRGILGAFESGVTRPLRALGVPIPYLPQSVYGGDASSMTPYMDALRRQEQQAQPTAAATPPTAAPTPAPAAPPSTGTGLGGASALGRQPGVGLKMPEKPPEFTRPAGKSYEASAMEYYDTYGEKAEALDKQTDEAIKQANESVKGKAFEGYKEALEKEALQAGADKEQAKYMSLFKAGLAMMAGTSRHAFENIGKGAMVGAEDYQAAVKDLKKAEKERQKEFALIEQAQRAEALGDRDKAIDRLDKARDRQDARLRYTGEGIYKATNLDKQQAYDIAKTQFSSSSDIFRTHLAGQYQMGAAGVSADARIAALLATAGSRGQMNQKQVGDALLQLQTSPEAIEYRKKLLKEKGERAANTPEFKAAMDNFVGGLFQKYYGGTTRGGGLLSGGLNLSDEDMQLIRRNLATGG